MPKPPRRPDSDEFDVELHWRELPADVQKARDQASREHERLGQILEPRIAAHLEASRIAVDAMGELHRLIADRTNLDLGGDSRPAGAWVIAGRCIGLARAMLTLLSAGYAAEAVPTARALHEATRLLDAVADDDDPELLRRWLVDDDDEWVRPRETRKARERMRDRLEALLREQRARAVEVGDTARAELIAALLEGPGVEQPGATSQASRTIYDMMSRIGHTRRSGLGDALALPLRQMAAGPHPNPFIRADYALWATHVIEEVLLSVGEVLSRFAGPGYFQEQVRPIIEALAAVRLARPLDSEALEQLR